MKQVRAMVLPGPDRPLEPRSFALPPLEEGAAVLAVALSEVCGTDVHLARGRLAGVPYPIIPGHVAVGTLEAIRGVVRDVEGRALAEGDRVTFLDVHGTCNACWYCLVARATTRCPSRRVYGITYGVADGLAGGWAEKIVLKPGTRCMPLGAADPAAFMAGGCALPTALHAVERAEIKPGDDVLVVGSGPVGLSAVIVARLCGAGRVLCLGAPEERLAAARAAGAAATLDFRAAAPAARRDWVAAHTAGRGADVVIEAAGAPGAVVEAMRAARDAGRVVIAGQYTDGGDATFNPHADLNRKHLDVRGSWGSDFSHFHRAVRLMQDETRARLFAPLAPRLYPLARAAEALADVAQERVIKALIDPRA